MNLLETKTEDELVDILYGSGPVTERRDAQQELAARIAEDLPSVCARYLKSIDGERILLEHDRQLAFSLGTRYELPLVQVQDVRIWLTPLGHAVKSILGSRHD